jgi:hypothetical protein
MEIHKMRIPGHRGTAVPAAASEDGVAVRRRDHAVDVRHQLQRISEGIFRRVFRQVCLWGKYLNALSR